MNTKTFQISRRVLTFGLWTLTAVAAADLLYNWLHGLRSAAAQPTASYTVTLEQTSTKEGQTRHANICVYAVRSDGSSMSRITSSPYAPQPDVFRTLRLASGTMVQIRDVKGLKVTTATSRPLLVRLPSNNCLLGTAENYVGEETMEGYRAAELTQAERTSWYARDYGCSLVHERWVFQDGTVNDKKLISLVVGEPDPALFHIPSGYREVTPSEWHNPSMTGVPAGRAQLDNRHPRNQAPR